MNETSLRASGRFPGPFRGGRGRWPAPLLLTLLAASCEIPDPKQEFEVIELETYWAIDRVVGETQYLAPVVRLRLRNRGTKPRSAIQLTAAFKRKGESDTWGSGWERIAVRRPLEAGQDALVILKSDAAYFSSATPAAMFEHKLFKDARVEVFVKAGASSWVKLAEAEVERRVGSRAAREEGP